MKIRQFLTDFKNDDALLFINLDELLHLQCVWDDMKTGGSSQLKKA